MTGQCYLYLYEVALNYALQRVLSEHEFLLCFKVMVEVKVGVSVALFYVVIILTFSKERHLRRSCRATRI